MNQQEAKKKIDELLEIAMEAGVSNKVYEEIEVMPARDIELLVGTACQMAEEKEKFLGDTAATKHILLPLLVEGLDKKMAGKAGSKRFIISEERSGEFVDDLASEIVFQNRVQSCWKIIETSNINEINILITAACEESEAEKEINVYGVRTAVECVILPMLMKRLGRYMASYCHKKYGR